MDTCLQARLFCLMAACITLSTHNTIAAQEESKAMPEEISLLALLEVNPHDVVTIDPKKLVKESTAYLSTSNHLAQSEKYKLYLLRGHAHIYAHEFADALRDFDEAAKLRPKDDFEVLFLRNTALGNQAAFGNRELLLKAKTDAENLIKMRPDSARAYFYMASWLMSACDDNGCIAYCDKSIALDKNHPEVYYIRALSHKRKREYQEALDDLDNCIKLGGIPGTKGAARPFIERATLLLDPFDNPALALRDLTMAQQINPTSYDVKFELWHLYVRQGKYEIADYLSRKIAKEYPKSKGVVDIVMLIRKGALDEALKLAEDMISEAPAWAYGYYWRGVVHFAKGEYDAAKRDYDKASSFNDDNMHTRGTRAYLMASVATIRNGSEALKLAIKCCEQSRYKNAKYIMLLAMSHAAAGHKEEAIKFGREALEKLSESSHLREEYEKRLKVFKEGKMYDFSPASKVLDYLFF